VLRLDVTLRRAVLATCAAVLMLAAPAAAHTYKVSGEDIAVDEDNGVYRLQGGLLGSFKVTSFQTVATSPVFHGTGTEKFEGCLDRRRDGSCAGDPKGTLSFSFDYWALYDSPDPASLVWGACWHPVASGTGDFRGARGVLQMVDTPTKEGVQTDYIGTIRLEGRHGRGAVRAAAAARPACGSQS
jgi:hypothetical protein